MKTTKNEALRFVEDIEEHLERSLKHTKSYNIRAELKCAKTDLSRVKEFVRRSYDMSID